MLPRSVLEVMGWVAFHMGLDSSQRREPANSLLPERVMELMTPPSTSPYSADMAPVMTWVSSMESSMTARPRLL